MFKQTRWKKAILRIQLSDNGYWFACTLLTRSMNHSDFGARAAFWNWGGAERERWVWRSWHICSVKNHDRVKIELIEMKYHTLLNQISTMCARNDVHKQTKSRFLWKLTTLFLFERTSSTRYLKTKTYDYQEKVFQWKMSLSPVWCGKGGTDDVAVVSTENLSASSNVFIPSRRYEQKASVHFCPSSNYKW